MCGGATVTRTEDVAAHCRMQARSCAELGSPLYAVLLDAVAADVDAGGPAAEVLGDHAGDPGADALALRLMGGVHRLVLDRRAPALAVHYPSVGGTADGEQAWPALRELLVEHRDELRGLLRQAPQTNEVGRAAALLGGLHHLLAGHRAPLRLLEIGASAGLNLLADRFRVVADDGTSTGPQDSPVVLHDAWTGVLPPAGPPPEVVERLGCDTAPVDARSTAGRLTLTSYVWPDQHERLERLRGALALAARHDVTVRRARAADFLADQAVVPGTITVLWHSVMWQYLPAAEQAAVLGQVDRLGAAADGRSGFAYLRMEPDRAVAGGAHPFEVRLRTWPGGLERHLGVSAAHGLPTTWG